MSKAPTPATVLREATLRYEASAAVSWIAEGHPLTPDANKRSILRALLAHGGRDADAAIERMTRELLHSTLDTAAVLFSLDQIRSPEQFRRALETLVRKSPTGRLDGLTDASVAAAQRTEPTVMAALCAIAGISTKQLADWADASLPDAGNPDWSLAQIRAAMSVIDRIVEGKVESPVPAAQPVRALEFLFDDASPGGWKAVEQMRRVGVPYEVLLAQRDAGGGWLAHRNKTSSQVAAILAEELCDRLSERGVDYLRPTNMGGSVVPSEIRRLAGSGSVGLIVRDRRQKPIAAVAFSVARDGGTARSSGSRLLKLRTAKLPVMLVLAGPGWAERNESADLARVFEGDVYTDESIGDLADELAHRAAQPVTES